MSAQFFYRNVHIAVVNTYRHVGCDFGAVCHPVMEVLDFYMVDAENRRARLIHYAITFLEAEDALDVG